MLLFRSAVGDQGGSAQVEADATGQRRNTALRGDEVVEQLLPRSGRSSAELGRPTYRCPPTGRDLRLPLSGQGPLVGSGCRARELVVDGRKVIVEPRRPLPAERGVLGGQVDVEFIKSGRCRCRGVVLHTEYYNLVVRFIIRKGGVVVVR